MNDDRPPGPKFWYFHEWLDEQGRFWAEVRGFQFPSDARREHRLSSAFRWVTKDMHDTTISSLYARDAIGMVEIQQACRPGEDPERSPEVSSQGGAGRVSSVVKAEAQRRDPGSTPGGSTLDLPF